MQKPRQQTMLSRFLSTFIVLVMGLGFSKPAQADGFFDYWLSGELGADMFALVGISEDDLVEIVMDVEDSVDDFTEKAENTVKQIQGECFEGVTFMDDIDAVVNELEFYWEYKGVITEGFFDELSDDFVSGRARDRIFAYGKGLGVGAYEGAKETLFLAADGIAYGTLYTFTDGDEQYLEYYSQIANAYNDAAKNGVHHGEVTGQLLEGLAGIPGQLADDFASGNTEAAGATIGSFFAPLKTAKVGLNGVRAIRGARTVTPAVSQAVRTGARTTARTAPRVQIVTRTGSSNLPGRVLGEYSAVKQHPSLGVPRPGEGIPNTRQATYAGYRVTDVELTEAITIHRYHNNGAKGRFWDPDQRAFVDTNGAGELGAFWSLGEPVGTGVSRIDSAVLPQWGNTMTHRTTVQLPAGTVIHVGEAANQGGFFVGGGSQLIVKGGIKKVIEGGGGKVLERVQLVPKP